MTENDVRRIPLPRRYAPLLGPVVGAAAGCSGFLMMEWTDALVMIGLFAVIGLLSGILIYFYDLKRSSE